MSEADDRLAIMDKVYRYCRSVDRLDIPVGHSCWHEDGTAKFPRYDGSGRSWIDFICEEHLLFLDHSHQVTNILIELDGDRADSESYVTATLRRKEDDGRIVLVEFWARYLDTWSKRDGEWAIDHRECVVDYGATREITPIPTNGQARRDAADPSYAVLKG